nr:MAG TPA: hypothetical protein [Caudoviricetes sp.]
MLRMDEVPAITVTYREANRRTHQESRFISHFDHWSFHKRTRWKK